MTGQLIDEQLARLRELGEFKGPLFRVVNDENLREMEMVYERKFEATTSEPQFSWGAILVAAIGGALATYVFCGALP